MLLGRLRIRSRLALLILIPLLAALVPTGVAAVEIGHKAARAAATARLVRSASQVAVLARALQKERLASVGLLLGQVEPSDVLLAQAATQDAETVVAGLGLPSVDTTLPNLSHLGQLRTAVLARAARPVDVIATYSLIISSLLDSIRLLDVVDGDTAQGQGTTALDAVLRGNEGFAVVLASMAAGRTPDISSAYITGIDLMQGAGNRFVLYATKDQAGMYGVAQAAIDSRLGKNFNQALIGPPGATIGILKTPPSYADVVSMTGVGQYVESKVINDTLATADSAVRQGITRVAVFLGLSLVLIVVAIVLGVAVARSVAVPVRRLTRSAESVAQLAESELVRVTDDDSGEADPVRLRPIEMTGRDELADFARAFSRVQETAARLVERQVASRRNVALMFGHVGRRTQNLVGRQISLIDRLESRETEPGRLSDLYRLDHISSRLLRNASSLVVLSGSADADQNVAPIALDEVVRIGLAEIEDYTRVDVAVPATVYVVPAFIDDLVLLLAELMENATGFSPPGTRVTVAGDITPDGLRVRVVDHGLGMPPDRLAEENTRLTRRERLDLAPTEVLGLFVVGRLARRHGLTVALTETRGGGVTAIVDLPARLLADAFAGGLVGAGTSHRASGHRAGSAAALGSAAAWGSAAGGPATGWGGGEVVEGRLEHSPRELEMLGRATVAVRTVQPWNAFALASPPALPAGPAVGAASASAPTSSWPVRLTVEPRPVPPPMYPPAVYPPTSVRAAVPPIPRPRSEFPVPRPGPAQPPSGVPVPGRPGSSTLSRRVPGASLSELEGTAPVRAVPLAPPASPDEVRDSLAEFESGIARAMREAQQGDG